MNELQVRFHGLDLPAPVLLGRLGMGFRQPYTQLEFDTAFLGTGLDLSPLHLERTLGLLPAPMDPFDGLHGLFADSLPDSWGLSLINRACWQRDQDTPFVGPLEKLAFVGPRAMGALSYVAGPPPDVLAALSPVDLSALADEAARCYTGTEGAISELFFRNAAPPGGAQPKALIGLNEKDGSVVFGAGNLPEGYSHWLVKFPTGQKRNERCTGAIEFLYFQWARACGIRMMESRLIEADKDNAYFVTRRFDRLTGNRRRHIHSAAGLLHKDAFRALPDYLDLFKLSDFLTGSHAEKVELYRRAVFNIVAGNRDDHAKNFAFLMQPNGEWINTPAYDLTFSKGFGEEHCMSVFRKAGHLLVRDDLIALARRGSIPTGIANAAIDDVLDSASVWLREAPHHAIPKNRSDRIQSYIKKQRARLRMAPAGIHESRVSQPAKVQGAPQKKPPTAPNQLTLLPDGQHSPPE